MITCPDITFFVGLHQVADMQHFDRCMLSVNRLKGRKSGFSAKTWIMDSGAFTEITNYGEHRMSTEEYADLINEFSACGNLVAAVAQDYMCEPVALEATGLTITEHQKRTVSRYRALDGLTGVYVLPVLQGYAPVQYTDHIAMYADLLPPAAWVGVGSVCKRNAHPSSVEQVLLAIRNERPDLRLHGFGIKVTALQSEVVRKCLSTADSMAWSFAARRNGGDANDWREAKKYINKIEKHPVQRSFYDKIA